MGTMKKFCCCCNTRTGSIFTGFYSMVSSALFMGLVLLRFVVYPSDENNQYYTLIMATTLTVFGLHLVISFSLVLAAYKDAKVWFYPWMTTASLGVLEGTAMVVWLLVLETRYHGKISAWELVLASYHMVNLIITCYCLGCVFSQLHALVQGKGTAEFYRTQQERSRRLMTGAQYRGSLPSSSTATLEERVRGATDMDSLPPAYEDHPPPYSLVDPVTRSIDDTTTTVDESGSVTVTRLPRPLPAVTLAVTPVGVPPPDYDSHRQQRGVTMTTHDVTLVHVHT